MNTKTETHESDRPDDLREAIQQTAFIRTQSGAVIIGNENTGARDEWIFDFRALLLQPKWLDRYAEIFWQRYKDKLPFQVGGVETAGIPLVTAIVMKGVALGHPVNGFYIRKSRKRIGLMKYIEGTLTEEPIIFVDDLINSGGSLKKQIDILAREGKTVTDAFVLLAFRAPEAYAFLSDAHISLKHLFTLKDFDLPMVATDSIVTQHDSYETLWHFAAPNPSFHVVVQKSVPVVDERRIYFGCDDGVFRALDRESGDVAWEYAVGRHPKGKGILSSPVLHDGLLYFGAYDGNVYALDAQTGAKQWENNDADWVGSSPAISPELNLLFIGLEFGLWKKHGGIAALNLKTGKSAWSAQHTSLTHGSPLFIAEESLVVIGSNNGLLYAYDAKTGTPRWTFATRGDIKTRPAYDSKRRTIICASMDGTVYGVSAKDGSSLFAHELGAGVYSTPLIHNDTIYVSSLDKCIYALSAETWKERWVYETNGRIFASPIIANGSLWIGSNDGKLYELDPDTGALRSFFQTTERIVCAITVRDQYLYVPTVANEMYCIKKADGRR
jgi:outer membrane protein assembly factor BamB/orotate phosphoribosyltransferase